MHRPPLTALSVAALAGLVLAGCSSGSHRSSTAPLATAAAAAPVAATVPLSVPPGTTLRVADQLQVLEQELSASGQDTKFPYAVQYANFVGGPPMLQAFQAGAVDIGFVADTPLIFAQAARQNIVGVAAWAPQHSSDALVVPPGSTISSWSQLKNKKVAYQQGTVLEAVVLQGLHSAGLTLKDITTVNLPTTQISTALQGGSVDAGLLADPLTSVYLGQHPGARVVERPDDITDRVTFIIASKASLTNPGKEAAIADYLGRLERALTWINNNQATWARDFYVAKYKLPLALGERLMTETGPNAFIDLPGSLTAAQQSLADLYLAAGEIPTHLDTSAEFDGRFNAAVDAARGQ
ncbi:MAG TPA: ABC transporter substrate-binding protein [Acidimicrobiales bacterium]|nr:ABC transporter substrate-binding protein [Acidimicrobiales bacterium]